MTNTATNLTAALTHTAPATLVFETSIGHVSIKVKQVSVTMRSYAQYAQALEVRYIEQGKRAVRGTVLTDSHAWVILDGHHQVLGGHNECAVSYAPEHSTNMDDAIRATGATVLRDYRTHNPNG